MAIFFIQLFTLLPYTFRQFAQNLKFTHFYSVRSNNIPRSSKYIFTTRNGERLHTRQIEYFLEKYAERQGIPVKSTHKMRKTYASMLSVSGVPVDCISEMLGHSSLSTTYGYIYNSLTEQQTHNLINSAFD